MKGIFPIDKFRELRTPFYYYDTKVLRDTLIAVNKEVARYEHFDVHYAVKATRRYSPSFVRVAWVPIVSVGAKYVQLLKLVSLHRRLYLPVWVKPIGRSNLDWIMIFSVLT